MWRSGFGSVNVTFDFAKMAILSYLSMRLRIMGKKILGKPASMNESPTAELCSLLLPRDNFCAATQFPTRKSEVQTRSWNELFKK